MSGIALYAFFVIAIGALVAIAWYEIGDVLGQRSRHAHLTAALYVGFGTLMVFGCGPILIFTAFVDPRADLIAQAILRATGSLPSPALWRSLEGDALFGIFVAMAAGAVLGLVINQSNFKIKKGVRV